ncbi:MAG: hypothetical protein JWM98_2877 [Thermoleophilia bacterium]|nr:hypothetical protein [Thermoleophilia bacterium]
MAHAATGPPDPERLILAIADHLHEHCECRPGATGGARCTACDLRAQLRDVREQLLAWRAEGRRIAGRRDDAVGNGATHLERLADLCVECAALSGLANALRGHQTAGVTPPSSSSS